MVRRKCTIRSVLLPPGLPRRGEEPGCPLPPPAGGLGRAWPSRRGRGQPGCPLPSPAGGLGRAQPARRKMGQPGFPISPPDGRVWEGAALPGTLFVGAGGVGKPGFPIPLPGGRVWEGYALPGINVHPVVCGGAAWTAEVNVARRNGAGQRNHAVPILYASGITERSTMFQGRSPAGQRPVARALAPVQQR